MSDSNQKIPEEVIQKLGKLNEQLTNLEEVVAKICEGGVEEHYKRNAYEMASVDAMTLFLMDSLLWTLHGIRGEKAKNNEELVIDLVRTKKIMGDLKEYSERTEAPRINETAAKNFVRNALWEDKNAK